eukprot:scaffold409297_cov18-Prasinocladus_malaysianus.AAC.1
MDRQIGRQKYRKKDRPAITHIDRHTGRQTDRQECNWVEGGEQNDGCLEVWLYGRMDGWMDGWMDGCEQKNKTNRQIHSGISTIQALIHQLASGLGTLQRGQPQRPYK